MFYVGKGENANSWRQLIPEKNPIYVWLQPIHGKSIQSVDLSSLLSSLRPRMDSSDKTLEGSHSLQ